MKTNTVLRLDSSHEYALSKLALPEGSRIWFDRDTLLVAHYDVNFLFVVFRIRNGVVKKREWLLSTGYMKPANPEDEAKAARRYYCYYLDEEVSLGDLDIREYLAKNRLANGDIEGAPYFAKGEDVLGLRTNPPVS